MPVVYCSEEALAFPTYVSIAYKMPLTICLWIATNKIFFLVEMRVLSLMSTVLMLRSGLCFAKVGQNACAFVSSGVCLHNSFQLCFRCPSSKFAKNFEQSGTRFMASSSGGRGAKGITIDRMLQQQVCARIICILVVLVIMLFTCFRVCSLHGIRTRRRALGLANSARR